MKKIIYIAKYTLIIYVLLLHVLNIYYFQLNFLDLKGLDHPYKPMSCKVYISKIPSIYIVLAVDDLAYIVIYML